MKKAFRMISMEGGPGKRGGGQGRWGVEWDRNFDEERVRGRKRGGRKAGKQEKGVERGTAGLQGDAYSVPARTSGHSLSPNLGFAYLGPVSSRLAEPDDQRREKSGGLGWAGLGWGLGG